VASLAGGSPMAGEGSVREVLQKPLRRDGHGMRVISQSPDPLARMHTMTKRQGKSGTIDVKALLAEDEEFLRALVRTALQEVLEAEMTEALGAEKGERAAGRQGYRSGYYGRTLITRVGKLELRVPQDRTGRFSTELFERYQRSERALVAALAEMYVQGVSTRKVKAITEELCGHSFSASSISAINQRLDDGLAQFADRRLVEAFPSAPRSSLWRPSPGSRRCRAAGRRAPWRGPRSGPRPRPPALATSSPIGLAQFADRSDLRYTHQFYALWLAEAYLRRGDRAAARSTHASVSVSPVICISPFLNA